MITTKITEDNLGVITLDRPAKRNALTEEMLVQLHTGVLECIRADVRLILLTSSTEHFCAGADLGEWSNPSANEATRMSRTGIAAFNALAGAPMPTLAVLNGVVAGGGLELALACDLRIGTDTLLVGLPELGLANLPSWGGLARLANLVGTSSAQQLLFTGQLVTGEQAHHLGLINWLVVHQDLDAKVQQTVGHITGVDHASALLAKAVITGTDIEPLLAAITSQSEESQRRKLAFFERRKRATT